MKRTKAGKEKKTGVELNKYKRLVKQLMIRAAVVLFVVGGLAGVMLLANGMQDSAKKESDEAKQALSTIKSKTNGLNKQIEDLGAASQIYADLAEQRKNMEFAIQPEAAREFMARLKDEHFITTLNLEFSKQEVVDLSQLSSNEEEAVRIKGVMNLGGLSDQYIYQFIQALEAEAPGIVKLNTLSLVRRQDISIDVLSQISRGNPIETVSGTIEFNWYGFVRKPGAEDASASDKGA